ncbi:MAG: M28 family peptidase [Chloroflexi bacterium]|nr:hypothetical protein [Anaerolineae bacterium]MBL1172730.1 M28 family peptidase [Chloroflexota bacterium]MDL1925630.1 M28 family peptidase [Anaerolineae bacterium AMX1]
MSLTILKRLLILTFGLLALLVGGFYAWRYYRTHRVRPQSFDAARAYQDVVYQTSLGPRTPGSEAHELAIAYFRNELQKANWQVDIQIAKANGKIIKNVIARRSDVPPKIILGAHYDSRLMADKDPDPKKTRDPVPGANDGASGAAVLLELGRVLPVNSVPVWLVFFDAEDQGGIPGWDEWSLGASAFVNEFALKPRAVIIVDMVGDPNLNILQEKQSSPRLIAEIWDAAKTLGFENYFLPIQKYTITDDHVPFLRAGIPAVDIIDIDYHYWHTSHDTADKVSPESLRIVGSTLLYWIGQQGR